MGSKIYVGGLPYATTDAQLQEIFSVHGTVESARVITDKFTGRSRGFGFVEMASSEDAQKAIQALNGTDLDGRNLTVNEARPQEKRSGGFGDRGAREGVVVAVGSQLLVGLILTYMKGALGRSALFVCGHHVATRSSVSSMEKVRSFDPVDLTGNPAASTSAFIIIFC
jgi:RNA recognition motif-containing protein